MTKLEKLKQEIGYSKESKQCQNCKHFKSYFEKIEGFGYGFLEKNLRCDKYNFATKKTTTCNEHEKKEKQNG